MKTIFDKVEMNHLYLKNRLVRSATWEGIAKPDGGITEKAYEIYEKLEKAVWEQSFPDLPAYQRMISILTA